MNGEISVNGEFLVICLIYYMIYCTELGQLRDVPES
jgi:hypothetical protein